MRELAAVLVDALQECERLRARLAVQNGDEVVAEAVFCEGAARPHLLLKLQWEDAVPSATLHRPCQEFIVPR